MTLTDLPAVAASGIEISLLDATEIPDLAAAADDFLVGEEFEQLAAIGNALRRREWLAARICAKLMIMRKGLIADAQDCRISKSANGRPYILKTAGGSIPGVGDCSLSHKGRFACACLCGIASVSVGVDIEEISPRLQRFRSAFLNPFDSIGGADSTDADLAALWVLKEAYSKAVGVGIRIGFGNLICDADPETGVLGVRTVTGARAQARYVVYNGHVIGVCFADTSSLRSIRE